MLRLPHSVHSLLWHKCIPCFIGRKMIQWPCPKQSKDRREKRVKVLFQIPKHGFCDALTKARNTLEHAQVHTASHCTELSQCTSVDSTNNLRYTLRTCSCVACTQSDRCRSLKVSINFCMLSVDRFLAISIVAVVNRRVYVYSE